jgi:endonuclease YncB( thermonuclease family)
MRASYATIGCVFALGVLAGAMLSPPTASRARAPDEPDPQASVRAPAVVAIVGAYRGDLLRVIDGDTFEARVRLWPGLDITTRVRLRGIDAPEMSGRCLEERRLAETARDALAAILAEGDITVRDVGIDKYGGRVLAAAATRRTPDVGAALLDRGIARSYAGRRREGWCNS